MCTSCQVLLVGNPTLPLKGFDVALAALQAVNCVMPIHVTWICQVEPSVTTLPALASVTFDMEYIVKPKQVRRAPHAYLCTALLQHIARGFLTLRGDDEHVQAVCNSKPCFLAWRLAGWAAAACVATLPHALDCDCALLRLSRRSCRSCTEGMTSSSSRRAMRHGACLCWRPWHQGWRW